MSLTPEETTYVIGLKKAGIDQATATRKLAELRSAKGTLPQPKGLIESDKPAVSPLLQGIISSSKQLLKSLQNRNLSQAIDNMSGQEPASIFKAEISPPSYPNQPQINLDSITKYGGDMITGNGINPQAIPPITPEIGNAVSGYANKQWEGIKDAASREASGEGGFMGVAKEAIGGVANVAGGLEDMAYSVVAPLNPLDDRSLSEKSRLGIRGLNKTIGGVMQVGVSPLAVSPIAQKLAGIPFEAARDLTGGAIKQMGIDPESADGKDIVDSFLNAIILGAGVSKSLIDGVKKGDLSLKDAWEELKQAPGEVKGMVDVATKNMQIKKGVKQGEKATSLYREVLKPNASEIRTLEIKRNKDLNDYYALAAKDKLPIKTGEGGKYDIKEAVNIVNDKTKKLRSELENAIKERKDTDFSFAEIKQIAKKQIDERIKNDTLNKQATKNLNTYIDDAVKKRGDVVSGENIYNFKQGMGEMAYDGLNVTANDVAKILERVTNSLIENKYKGTKVVELKKNITDYITLETLLKNASTKVIKSGALGVKLGQLAGAGVGAAVSGALGVPGAGAVPGWTAGGKMVEYMASPERAIKKANKLTDKANSVPIK